MHTHPCYQVVYVLHGAMKFASPQTEGLVAHSGEAAIIPPNKSHNWGEYSGRTTKTFSMLFESISDNRHGKLSTVFGMHQQACWKVRIDKSLASMHMATIRKIFGSKRPVTGEMLSGQLFSFLAVLGRCTIEQGLVKTNPKVHPAIEEALRHIHHDPGRNFTLRELSDYCYLSPTRFSELFREYTRYSPMQYVIFTKMEKAKSLLLYTRQTISEIAGYLGFSSIHYFSRAFKKQVGIPPTQYRAQITKS